MINTISLCDGKYTFKHDDEIGSFICLRYGGNWRNFTGDGAVLSLFQYIQDLELELKKSKNQLEMMKEDYHAQLSQNALIQSQNAFNQDPKFQELGEFELDDMLPIENPYYIVVNKHNRVIAYGNHDEQAVKTWADEWAIESDMILDVDYEIILIDLLKPTQKEQYYAVINKVNKVIAYGHHNKEIVKDWASQFAEGQFSYEIKRLFSRKIGL
ncbi:MAG TPA: hypothetical protein VI815_02470 [Candidatus Nanoarchaeia archaeon]|nr:hypothetical protein [Candidatus Nanoarchaeia archaeon]